MKQNARLKKRMEEVTLLVILIQAGIFKVWSVFFVKPFFFLTIFEEVVFFEGCVDRAFAEGVTL